MSMDDATPRNLSLWEPPHGALPDAARFVMPRRAGGVSRGPYESLNLGLGVGDDDAAVQENRRLVREALGVDADGPTRLHQVHGRTLVPPKDAPCEADGFLVIAGDPWVAVSAADCAPVAIVAEDGSRGALLHCGWRGARERIAEEATRRLAAAGVPPATLRAVIGPCLMPCCFPIGPDVAALFDARFLRPHPSGQASLDLPGAIAATMTDSGIPAEGIHQAAECTSCGTDRYYSHRRDRGVTGRHWALLRLRPRGS